MGMMDLKEKESLSEDMGVSGNKRCCADCKTTKTPLWRGGPAGPKSLCNACGIRYRKKRSSSTVGPSRGSDRKREKSQSSATTTATTTSSAATTTSSTAAKKSVGNGGKGLSESLKIKLMAFGKDLLQRSPPVVKKQRFRRSRKLKEEEQAAVSLMALSCGSVFA